jgi:hypothetical protein
LISMVPAASPASFVLLSLISGMVVAFSSGWCA